MTVVIDTMEMVGNGAQLFRGALDASAMDQLLSALDGVPWDRAGVRLHGMAALDALLAADGCIGRPAAAFLASRARPVRAILFDKSAAANWALGWHQDRTIAVEKEIAAPGFGPWTRKAGIVHVEPPFEILSRMVTLRVHLDAVDAANGPLLVAIGSHRLGRLPESEIQAVVDRSDALACLAAPGDIWAYATPILHASEAATHPTRRRVLQVDYSADTLPFGLRWKGV